MKLRGIVITGAAALAACGALGMFPAGGQAGTTAAATWTEQAPATSPPARAGEAMAYDAATGTVVLFGGEGLHGASGETWTWDGTTWTRQAPAASPPARFLAAMAYDAATSTTVLFGGLSNSSTLFRDTWVWG